MTPPDRRIRPPGALLVSDGGPLTEAIAAALTVQGWEPTVATVGDHGWDTASGVRPAAEVVADLEARTPIGALVVTTDRRTEPGAPPPSPAGPTGDEPQLDRLRSRYHRGVDTLALAAELVVPAMVRRGTGAVVAVTTTAGRRGDASDPVAAADDAGVVGLVRSLARSVGPAGVTVNIVAHHLSPPGAPSIPAEGPRRRSSPHAPRPLAVDPTPNDVAEAVAFLASGEAAFITGATLPVDGGESMGAG